MSRSKPKKAAEPQKRGASKSAAKPAKRSASKKAPKPEGDSPKKAAKPAKRGAAKKAVKPAKRGAAAKKAAKPAKRGSPSTPAKTGAAKKPAKPAKRGVSKKAARTAKRSPSGAAARTSAEAGSVRQDVRAPDAANPLLSGGEISGRSLVSGEEPMFGDVHLLETSRTKWQYGQWDELACIALDDIRTHPDRAKLALLVAAAKSHLGDFAEARTLARQAEEWGCRRDLIARVMASMAFNSLGRLATCLGDGEAAAEHFRDAIGLVETHADVGLMARTRRIRETAGAGLVPDAVKILEDDLQAAPTGRSAGITALRQEIESLQGRSGENPRAGADWPEQTPEPGYLFVGSSPRSGTTALVSLLNAHPHVLLGDERYGAKVWRSEWLTPDYFTPEFFLSLHEFDHGRLIHGKETVEEHIRSRGYAEKFPTARLFGDKFPFLLDHLDYVRRMFPGSKVVFILRNPVSVCESAQVRYEDPDDKNFDMDGRTLLQRWNKSNRQALEACKSDDPITVLCYERLVKSASAVERLFASLGLDPGLVDTEVVGGFLNTAEKLNEKSSRRNDQLRFDLINQVDFSTYRELSDSYCILKDVA